MLLSNLDLTTLRTLVTAADLGGYGRAADRLGLTASAVSLQMKRLQDDIGAPLFHKVGRSLALTELGEIVLRHGRRLLEINDELLDTVRGARLAGCIRLGFSQDFADTVLPVALSQFLAVYPLIQLEVHIEGNAALVDGVESGRLDLALAVGHAERATAQVLGALELAWIAGAHFVRRAGQPLPLVVLGPQCAFRKEALRQLDHAGIPWRIAAVSPSLAGLWASALGGLGVTLRTRLGIPARLLAGSERWGLPYLGTFEATLHRRPQEINPGVERLASIVAETFHAIQSAADAG